MNRKVPLLEHLGQAVSELVAAAELQAGLVDVLARLGAQTTLQLALEEGVTRIQSLARDDGAPAIVRNGQRWRRVTSAVGPLRVAIPKLRHEDGIFRPVVESVRRGSEIVRRLTQGMYVRGESTRDIPRTFKAAYGVSMMERDRVSSITREIKDQYEQFRRRDLKDLDVIYLILDAMYAGIRKGTDQKEGLLCAYGFLGTGKRVLLGLAPGSRESSAVCSDFLRDLQLRGLREPILVTHDGGGGWLSAVPEFFPRSLKQRCQRHKMENILGKVPDQAHDEIHKAVRAIFDAPSLKQARREAEFVLKRYRKPFPSAMECLEKDLDALLVHMRCPRPHWRRVRTSNHLERLFEEGRRRLKVIPRMPDEEGTLRLFYATIVEHAQTWHGLHMTEEIQRQLSSLRQKVFGVKRELVTV